MERVVGLKRRSYLGLASAPALSSAFAVFALLASLGAGLVHVAFGLSWTEATIAASVACAAALVVHAIQLLGSPRIACVLGVDGLEVRRASDIRTFGRFIPWSDVQSVARAGSGVLFHVRGSGLLTVRAWTQPLHLDAVALLRAFRQRSSVDESDGYRELDVDPKVLVRVVEDPRQTESRRRAAFEKLDREEQALVLSSLADPATREALNGHDE